MARIAEGRRPAEPHSPEQKDRYRRVLRAAARLGSVHGSDRMQMTDVAKEAGVAIATLYRYFPSKTDLFVAVLRSQVEHLAAPEPQEGRLPSEAVADVLVAASRGLLARPKLATAMLQANNHMQLHGESEYTDASSAFHPVLLGALGIGADRPAQSEDHRLIRIVEQTWYGILISALNGLIDLDQSEADIRLATRLLLGPGYDGE